jgi:uncharacterized membrane-anchored protein
MKLSSRHASTSVPGLVGTARVDRRLSAALRRARPGDVLVVDHVDLDRAGAESVVESGAAVVVNASPFISGRFPNLGPEMLARAGVQLVEGVGPEALAAIRDGATVRVDGAEVSVRGTVVATGREVSLDDVLGAMEAARSGMVTQLASFTHNTTEFLRREEDLLLHGLGLPELDTSFEGRAVVVVVRAFDHQADLRGLRRFIREKHPVLVGVDAGADALLAAKLVPDLVVVGAAGVGGGPGEAAAGRGQVISDHALVSAREVLLHADASDRLVGADRLDRLGVRPRRVAAGGTSEDIALLAADHGGASLIVAVGSHATLDEFLDRQRSGVSSTFLTRLRLGPRLVDAKAVPALYSGRVRLWHIVLALLVGLAAVGLAVAATPVGSEWARAGAAELSDLTGRLVDALGGLLP